MKRQFASVLIVGALLGGCANSNLVGAWESTGEDPGAFEVGSVMFRDDGTYSADVNYESREMQDRGEWTYRSGTLTLDSSSDAPDRSYKVKVKGDTMTITNPETGQSVTMARVQG
ncbi:MAG: lipocalin family protein [Phycisphaerales bacterium JB039]